MPTDVDFDFGGSDSAPGSEDTIDAVRGGPSRSGRTVWALVGVAVLLAAIGVARSHSSARRSPSAPPSVAAPTLQTRLHTIALSPDPMGVTLAANVFGCPKVNESYPPTPSQLKSIMAAFPTFTEIESGPTIDGSSGLCSINFRAIDGTGDTLIVAVSAPPQSAVPLRVDVNTDPDNEFVGAEYTSDAGFHVEVGVFEASGQTVATLDEVNQLTQDTALTW